LFFALVHFLLTYVVSSSYIENPILPEPINSVWFFQLQCALKLALPHWDRMGLNSAEYRSSEAVKTWMDGSERRFDTLTVSEYDGYDLAAIYERKLWVDW
jgi:hypothetical protein